MDMLTEVETQAALHIATKRTHMTVDTYTHTHTQGTCGYKDTHSSICTTSSLA